MVGVKVWENGRGIIESGRGSTKVVGAQICENGRGSSKVVGRGYTKVVGRVKIVQKWY